MCPAGGKKHGCMSDGSEDCWPERAHWPLLLRLAELLFDCCHRCLLLGLCTDLRMPAVPQAAFAVHKVRQNEMQLAKMQPAEQEPDTLFYHHKYMELSPLKYNSKLMNSIWGLYNRYSVHNFKKNTDAAAAVAAEAGLSRWGPHNSY